MATIKTSDVKKNVRERYASVVTEGGSCCAPAAADSDACCGATPATERRGKVGDSQERYSDEEVYSAVSKSDVLTAVGEAGRGFIVDTARCLHYGSRGNRSDRFILLVSFTRVNCVKPGNGCIVLDPARKRLLREYYDSDPVRAVVLDSPL